MKYQLKEKAWNETFLVFATCALFSCSDDENDPVKTITSRHYQKRPFRLPTPI